MFFKNNHLDARKSEKEFFENLNQNLIQDLRKYFEENINIKNIYDKIEYVGHTKSLRARFFN